MFLAPVVVITHGAVFFLMVRGSCSPFRPSFSSLLFLLALSSLLLFKEDEVYGKYKENYRNEMVPLQGLSFEQNRYYNTEYKA